MSERREKVVTGGASDVALYSSVAAGSGHLDFLPSKRQYQVSRYSRQRIQVQTHKSNTHQR